VKPNRFSNCCAPYAFGAEQNPQVPLASEDAFLRQVPGNAETAVGGLRRGRHAAARPILL